MDKDNQSNKDKAYADYKYARMVLQWHGWASPVGLGLGFALIMSSLGVFLWMLHLATLI